MLKLKKLTVLFLFICFFIQCSSQADFGTVTAVYDGDTIKVRFQTGKEEKIRLIGIDAPETGSDNKEVKLKALFSKRFAFSHLYKKYIRMEYDWEKRDQYGRLLAYIWTKKGILFNELIIQKGYARVYTRFPYKSEYKDRFLKAEEYAKEQGNGIWKNKPYPLITRKEIADYKGRLVSYEFVCGSIQDKGNLLLLQSIRDDFGVPIYKRYLQFFPDISSWRGKKIIISGLLEEYKGKPQIMLFFPSQLK